MNNGTRNSLILDGNSKRIVLVTKILFINVL